MPRIDRDVQEMVDDVGKRSSGDPDVLKRDVIRWKTRMGAAGMREDRATPMDAFRAMKESPCCGGSILIVLLFLLAVVF